MPNKSPIIIDTDPGIDDAFALMYALSNPFFDIKLISSVSGNVNIETTTLNIRKLVGFSKRTIPLGQGAERPLKAKPLYAEHIHKIDGLGGTEIPGNLVDLTYPDAILGMKTILETTEVPLTIVALGPLTNVARLLIEYPHLKEKIKTISFMGGGLKGGNVTPCAEFNIFVDPEAARIVFESDIPLIMAGLDVTEKANIDIDTIEKLRDTGKTGEILVQMLINAYGDSLPDTYLRNLHDVVPLMVLQHPHIFKAESLYVNVELDGTNTRGMTFCDRRSVNRMDPNTDVLISLDIHAFRKELLEHINNMGDLK